MSMGSFTGLLIVIPTRNRSDLVPNAVRSVLDQQERDVRVMVSDNSNNETELENLAAYCRDLKDERVRYVRPPAPMGVMREHWEWAMQQALSDSSVSHVAYLTDRMVFKKGSLKNLKAAIHAHPSKIISYNIDSIFDWDHPIRIRQEPWTGQVVGVDSAELLALSAHAEFPPCLPRMVNCAAPRTVLEAMRERFGNVFSSLSPDYNFAYRSLAVEDMIAYLDESLLFHYALDRSNGHSAARGIMTDAFKDCMQYIDLEQILSRMPLPEIRTGCNLMLIEYLFVQEETKSPKFPPIDHDSYLKRLSLEVGWITDPEAREAARRLLAEHGAQEYNHGGNRSIPRKLIDKINWEMRAPQTTPVWMMLARTLKIKPPAELRLGFDTRDEAFAYAERYPRRRARDLSVYPFHSIRLSG